MFGRHHDDEPAPAARPLWADIPEICESCGARIDQAGAVFSPRPVCQFCEAALPCRPVPAPVVAEPPSTIAGAAMGALLRHQVTSIYGPGGAIERYDDNVRRYGATTFGGYDYLRTTGVPYAGRLTGWTKKGTYDSRGMLMELEIELERADGCTAMLRCESMVPDAHRHALAVGMPLDVRVDANDWSAVLVVWE